MQFTHKNTFNSSKAHTCRLSHPFRSCSEFSEALSYSRLKSFAVKVTMATEEDKNLIEILEENVAIDMSKYISYVQSPSCGAIATFAGTTRDTFEGKAVLELRYEAYVPMAVKCIKSICASARSSWNLNSIAVAHRLGPVPVGEISVFIATSAVHREDGLDACKFIIDEVKASVPIWKKEVYTNGEVWKENSEFLERRDEFGNPAAPNNNAKPFTEKKGCCGGKVKIVEAYDKS